MTLDQLVADLQVLRSRYGGDIPVVLAGHSPAIRASIQYYASLTERIQAALAGKEEDISAVPHVVISYRNQQSQEKKRQGE